MSYSATRRKRFTAGVLAGAMAMTVMPILGFTGTAGALEEATGEGSVCEDAPTTTDFTDVTEADPSAAEIECLVGTGITTGTGDGTTYSPNAPVTRRQMALFLVRLADALEDNAVPGEITPVPAGDGETEFTDIAAEDAAIQAAIDRLADSGIAAGVTDTTFVPEARVTRRQMAKFIVRLQEFMAGEESTPDDAPDAFTDDEGDSGEAELNVLAAEGIFLGDGQGNVNPGDDISRRQMANVIIRKAQYHFEQGDITRLFEEDDSNQTFTVTPTEDVALEHDTARQYTADVGDAEVVDILLVECGNVTLSGAGMYSFAADTAPNDDEADPGTVTDAALTVVNGVASTSGDDVSPTGGTVTFSIAGGDTECVYPVVFDDSDDDDALNIDEDGAPTDEFGVGGSTTYVPAEATDGDAVSGTVTLVGADFAVVDNTSTAFFRSGDNYRIYDGTFCATVTAAEFMQNLSVDDDLHTVENIASAPAAPYDQDGPNTYCLEDVAPESPTDVTAANGAPADTVVDLTWTASATASVDSYNVYSNDEACADTEEDELTELASVAATETEYEATGLTPDTDYCFVVTSVDGDDESVVEVGTGANDPDNTAEETTVEALTQPTIESAELDEDVVTVELADENDVWILEFSEEMESGSENGATIDLTDGEDTIRIECNVAAADPNDGITDATCVLDDGADPAVDYDTLTITLDEDAEDRNAAGDDVIDYPLTITAVTSLEDWNGGGIESPVSIDDSDDLQIG